MTIRDLMLDLATGDASMNDAYIQEACGKIEVSSKIYDAAAKIAELPENGAFAIVQEAADAGLPTDTEGACTLACDAVKEAMGGFYDLLNVTAKKIKEQSTKDMKLVATLAKKFGIANNPANFATAFAAPLGKSVINANKGKVSLSDKRFLKGRYANKIATSYVKGVTSLLLAYGINITDVFKDPVIAGEVEKKFAKNATPDTFKGVASCLSDGSRLIKVEKLADKDSHYTDTVSADDVKELAVALYIVIAVSDAVIKTTTKPAKKTAIEGLNSLCEKENCEDKKVSKQIKNIGDDIASWKDNVEDITTAITKGFTDSIYSLYEFITSDKSAAPAPAATEDTTTDVE